MKIISKKTATTEIEDRKKALHEGFRMHMENNHAAKADAEQAFFAVQMARRDKTNTQRESQKNP